jgi:hypothetical protein
MTAGKIFVEGIIGAATIGVHVVFSPLLRASRMRWGATREETRQPMLGDEMSPHPRFVATRGITIHAPAENVWQWLVQLGCKRGGWYSYDLLDNGGAPSVDRIVPELQTLQVGDALPMTPDGKMSMPVRQIEPGRTIVMGGTLDSKTGKDADINDPNLREYFSWIITYALQSLDANTTRLVTRNRADWNPSLMNSIVFGLFVEAISFAMERKMALGIKARAERR